MAVRRNATSALRLKVITSVSESGVAQTKTRSISHVNPALTDEDSRIIGSKLASLQSYELDSVSRVDTAELAAE